MPLKFCFVFGLEPWLLPPAVEMIEVLIREKHQVEIFYAVYSGASKESGDLNESWNTTIIHKKRGLKKLMVPFLLGEKLKNFVNKNQPDVIIACDPLSLQATMWAKPDKKILIGYWGFEIIENPQKFSPSADYYRAKMLPTWLNKCQFVLAPSESRLHKITKRCTEKILGEVIYNCRKLILYGAQDPFWKNQMPLNDCEIRLVYAGRISPTQYIEEIMEAISLLPSKIGLLIAGVADDNYLSKLTSYAKTLNITSQVEFLGRLSREKTYSLIEYSDVGFVLYDSKSSAGASDPAPNKIGDYVAGNVWMIGSNQKYIYEWLEEKELGICINNIDPPSIAEAIHKILTNPKYSDKTLIKKIYTDSLNMNKQADKLLNVIVNAKNKAN